METGEAQIVQISEKANRPVKSYRCGSLNGAIWANEKATKEGMVSFMTASLKRSWKDKSGNWRDESVNLRKNDIAKAVLILNKMQEEIFFSGEAEDD